MTSLFSKNTPLRQHSSLCKDIRGHDATILVSSREYFHKQESHKIRGLNLHIALAIYVIRLYDKALGSVLSVQSTRYSYREQNVNICTQQIFRILSLEYCVERNA